MFAVSFGPQQVISREADGVFSVHAVDLDGDGDTDLLSASRYDDKIAAYRNLDGQGTFGSQQVISTDADRPSWIYAADLDGDGDADVLSTSFNDDKVAWYENLGGFNFGPQQVISAAADGALSVYASDLDSDGDLDVLSASREDDKIAWYENVDGQGTFGPQRVIYVSPYRAYTRIVYASDLDGDGDLDVLAGSSSDATVAWHENLDGSGSFGPQRVISREARGLHDIITFDVDQDGDMDVFSASRDDDKVAWYENRDGVGTFGPQRIITLAAEEAISIFSADVDLDGDLDLYSASGEKIAWYENVDGAGSFGIQQTISSDVDGAVTVSAGDVDGDGDLDVFSGSANDDKVAWYENLGSPWRHSDFGDAPQPYPTLLQNRGAEHAARGPTLGRLRDGEADGQPSLGAVADGADEEGVTITTLRVGQLKASVVVVVQNAVAGARLQAWIDFNGDGNWGGPGEQIAANQLVSNGENLISFDVPAWAADGNTYARFRVSTEHDLGPTGPAVDGEVEDYQLLIAPPVAASGSFFTGQQLISSEGDDARRVFATDLDGDGDMDVLSAASTDNEIAWHENDGSQNFTRRTITDNASLARSVTAADVDGDGDLDVLSASYGDDKIAWYENDGSQNFTSHTINTAADGATSVFVADLDGDGDMDVLSASYRDDRIVWYENDGEQHFTSHTISADADAARRVFAADMDGDGDMDVLSASSDDNSIAWYENDGNQDFTKHLISSTENGAWSVLAADVDGDGDMDVLSAARFGGTIAWHENDGSQQFTPHIVAPLFRARDVSAADIDGDGDVDLLGAGAGNNEIAWYENNGSQAFTTHMITRLANRPRNVLAADVDGDGDLDVLTASSTDDKVAWYENLNDPPLADPSPVTAGAVNQFNVGSATPGGTVLLMIGTRAGSTGLPPHTEPPREELVSLDIANPTFLGPAVADADGNVSLLEYFPAHLAGRTVLLQAVDVTAAATTNLVTFTLLAPDPAAADRFPTAAAVDSLMHERAPIAPDNTRSAGSLAAIDLVMRTHLAPPHLVDGWLNLRQEAGNRLVTSASIARDEWEFTLELYLADVESMLMLGLTQFDPALAAVNRRPASGLRFAGELEIAGSPWSCGPRGRLGASHLA